MENQLEKGKVGKPQVKNNPFDQKNVRMAVIVILLLVVLYLLYTL